MERAARQLSVIGKTLLAGGLVALVLVGCSGPVPATATDTAIPTQIPPPSVTPAPSSTPLPSATPIPSATSTPPPTPTMPVGQLRFPDLYQIGGSTLLEAGASITLVWQNPPPEAVHYDFFFYPFGESESRVMLGSDTSDRDGVGIPWSIPKGLKGSLQAAAFFPDGEVVFSEKVRNVYSGNVPFWNTPVPGTMYGQADQVPYIGETTLVDCRQDLAQEDPQTYQEWHDRLLVLYPELSVVEPGASCRLSDDTVIVTFSHSNANGLSSGQTIARFSTSGEVVSSARWAFCSSAGTRSYPVIQKLEAGNLVLSCFGEQSNAQDTILMDLDSLTIILQEPVS